MSYQGCLPGTVLAGQDDKILLGNRKGNIEDAAVSVGVAVGEVLYFKKGDCHVKYLYLPFILGFVVWILVIFGLGYLIRGLIFFAIKAATAIFSPSPIKKGIMPAAIAFCQDREKAIFNQGTPMA